MIKKKRVYAFIDAQNLNCGISKNLYKNVRGREIEVYKGWNLDYMKFRHYLRDKFHVEKAFLFIGFISRNRALYKFLTNCGYILVFKPTIIGSFGKVKGNVDSELVLSSCRLEYKDYDKAVIVSGDGDFFCLHKFLAKEDKLLAIAIPNSKSSSSLLKEFQKYKVYLEFERSKLEYIKKVEGVAQYHTGKGSYSSS